MYEFENVFKEEFGDRVNGSSDIDLGNITKIRSTIIITNRKGVNQYDIAMKRRRFRAMIDNMYVLD